MSIYHKLLQFYAKSVTGRTSNKHLFLGESHPYLPEQVSQDLFPSQSLNVLPADTSMENSSQKKFNPLTDTHPGLHEYD